MPSSIPKEVILFFMSALPVWELRGSIPFGVEVFHFDVLKASLISYAGNLAPLPFILMFLEPVKVFLSRHSRSLARFFDWLYAYAHRRHSKRFEILAELALVLFVALPLPGTGGWSGALVCVVFGYPKLRSFMLIAAGLTLQVFIVLALYFAAGTLL
jgi:uncharacterized membrane protein